MIVIKNAIDKLLKSDEDSIVILMKYLLLILVLLSCSTQIFVLTFFKESLSVETHLYAFGPVYTTMIVSYLLLELSHIRLGIHTFLLGSVFTQLMLLVFVTGHTNYVYVSYTNVALVAGLMLGPFNGVLYTVLIILCISLYFILVQMQLVDPNLIDIIQNNPELGLMATVCCFIFTGITVALFVFKQEQLYQTSVKERERTSSTLMALENLQQLNETRARQGSMIGWLGQQLITMDYAHKFIERSTPKIRELLELDALIVIIGDSKLPATIIRSINNAEGEDFNDTTVQVLARSIWMEPSLERFPKWLIGTTSGTIFHSEPIVESDGTIGTIIALSSTTPSELETFLSTVASIFSSAIKREQTQDQVRHLQKMEAIHLLAGGIAHDFNNLLMSIMGNTEIALTQVNNEEISELLQQINWATERGSSLTRKLLSFTKKEDSSPEVIDANEILKDILPIFEQVFKNKSVLSITYSAEPALIRIDRKDLESALLNLIINARDAIGQNGTVHITIDVLRTSDTPCVQMVISDNGTGIPETIIESIFEPFVTTKPNGTGLGLTMVRSMVERGKGNISVNSSSKGTQFSLSFPLEITKQIIPKQHSTQVHPIDSAKIILVVDDEQLVLQTIARMLQMKHFQVLQANGYTMAKELLSKHTVDLVLSDINMYGESGIDLRNFCLIEYPDIPVLLMTGFISQTENSEIPIIEKPLNTQNLVSFIVQGLSGNHLQ